MKIYVLGDSHSVAVERGLKARAKIRPLDAWEAGLFVSRFARIKEGVALDGVTLAGVAEMLRADPDALVVSMVGGNQFNTFGMMRNEVTFDFFEPSRPHLDPPEGAYIIPVAMLEDRFRDAVGRREGDHFRAFRSAFSGPIVHILPPPPKKDDEFIRTTAETYFRVRDIASVGVSPWQLRLKLWALQARITEEICARYDIAVIHPPAHAVTGKGFLASEYYGKDATHANGSYGELLLDQISDVARQYEATPA